jgi:hypothetical protein
MFNWISRDEIVWGRGSVAPRILNLGITEKASGEFHVLIALPPPPSTPGEINADTHWKGWWVGPRTGLEAVEKRIISCLLLGIKKQFLEPSRS